MNETKEVIRKQIKFYGRVQGVGFRYTAYYSATELGLTGWVHNEWDGSVLMEVQGTDATIRRLLEMLGSGRFISISDMEIQTIRVIPNERRFQVR